MFIHYGNLITYVVGIKTMKGICVSVSVSIINDF